MDKTYIRNIKMYLYCEQFCMYGMYISFENEIYQSDKNMLLMNSPAEIKTIFFFFYDSAHENFE